ncbi:hypothetical protein [Methanobacterium spitsbergense]|uniref:Uncharacterized protein n=1 Tax=Methanobacterium spitsbergense TaxID=2874285 RepID=A0A8T5UX01_9EURY|nr:hypothetical protein [Methanobacterium spitsbergense]MBZ2165209.1 hypothetical protein [Methanobacterium spitsbergense]
MTFKKLIDLKLEQKDGLDDIQFEISENGGSVSLAELISEAIDIFIKFYYEQAVDKHSPLYTLIGTEIEERK